jgi:metallo-beta-lactamase family protein
MSQGVAEGLDEGALSARESLEGMLNLIEAVPYNTKFEKHGLTLRYTDAGHILGSAMVEVWIDGVKLLFGGDMGPDYAPLLCKPAQHFTADAVLVESTYGPTPRDVIKYEDFGARIQKVIAGGGSVLLPAFALHKTQTLVYVLNKMKRDKVLQRDVPIFVDSSTAQECTKIYHKYKEYYDPEAKAFGEPFYAARYIEEREADTLAAHGKEPAIFISTSGMLDHAAAPKHLYKMAGDPRNAVFLVGYQAPTAVGAKLLKGAKTIDLPWEEREKDQDGKAGGFKRSTKPTEIKLQVEKVSGFSSHARGQQILEWLEQFRGVGRVFVVHGDKERATGLADAAVKMQLAAVAPKRGEEFVIEPGHRVKPGKPPGLKADGPGEPAPVDK